MPLTEAEKVRIRHHLGYLQVQPVYTFVLGVPAGVESTFMIEGAMERVLDSALPLVRDMIRKLDCTEEQRFDDQENHAVNRLGDIEINPEEDKYLQRGYRYWQGRLANVLGVMVNPYSKVEEDFQGGGVSRPVIG